MQIRDIWKHVMPVMVNYEEYKTDFANGLLYDKYLDIAIIYELSAHDPTDSYECRDKVVFRFYEDSLKMFGITKEQLKNKAFENLGKLITITKSFPLYMSNGFNRIRTISDKNNGMVNDKTSKLFSTMVSNMSIFDISPDCRWDTVMMIKCPYPYNLDAFLDVSNFETFGDDVFIYLIDEYVMCFPCKHFTVHEVNSIMMMLLFTVVKPAGATRSIYKYIHSLREISIVMK